ncbi:hypothetical protein GVAV_000791 [Gurleya vavrai]
MFQDLIFLDINKNKNKVINTMPGILEMIDTLNHKKLILQLEKEKDQDNIVKMLNEKVDYTFELEKLGKVQDLNSVQYLIVKMITALEDEKEEIKRALNILLKKADRRVFNFTDSRGNNCLHYASIIGDFKTIERMLENGAEILKNDENKNPYEVCDEIKSKCILNSYMKRNEESKNKNQDNDIKNHENLFKGQENKHVTFIEEKNDDSLQNSPTSNNEILNMKPNLENSNVKVQILPNFEESKIGSVNWFKHEKYSKDTEYSIDEEETKKMNDLETEKLYVVKYPGKLFISINTIIAFYTEKNNVKSVSVKVCVDGVEQETNPYLPNTHIEIGETLIFNIEHAPIKIKTYMVVEFNEKAFAGVLFKKENKRKILKSKLAIEEKSIDRFHNILMVHDFHWRPYETANVFTAFKDFFSQRLPNASILQTYMSFISNDELKYVSAPVPNDLSSLSFWIRYRLNSFYMWFRGYITIRGENSNIATHLWKRRFVQWYGYKILVYNEFSKLLIGVIDISNAKYLVHDQNTKEFFVDNSLKLQADGGIVEFQFDNREKYNNAIYALKNLLY